MNKFIFLDKDGTLIDNVPYNIDTKKIVLSPNTLEGLTLLQNKGFRFAVISNQSGIDRGFFTENAIQNVWNYIDKLLDPYQIVIDKYYFCPHVPNGNNNCTCRKPKPGLITKAISELSADATSSWMIGDILNDVEAGNRAGIKTGLLDNGNETKWEIGRYRFPHIIASDLLNAAKRILTYKSSSDEIENERYYAK